MDSKNILSIRKNTYYSNFIVAYFHGKNVKRYILGRYIFKKSFISFGSDPTQSQKFI